MRFLHALHHGEGDGVEIGLSPYAAKDGVHDPRGTMNVKTFFCETADDGFYLRFRGAFLHDD